MPRYQFTQAVSRAVTNARRALQTMRRPSVERQVKKLAERLSVPEGALIKVNAPAIDGGTHRVREETAQHAVEKLSSIQHPFVDEYMQHLLANSTNSITTSRAAEVLGYRKCQAAVPLLIEKLSNPNHTVMKRCALALGIIGDARAIAHLKRVALALHPDIDALGWKIDPDFWIARREAVAALAMFTNHPQALDVLAKVTAAAPDSTIFDDGVWQKAAQIILAQVNRDHSPLNAQPHPALRTAKAINDELEVEGARKWDYVEIGPFALRGALQAGKNRAYNPQALRTLVRMLSKKGMIDEESGMAVQNAFRAAFTPATARRFRNAHWTGLYLGQLKEAHLNDRTK